MASQTIHSLLSRCGGGQSHYLTFKAPACPIWFSAESLLSQVYNCQAKEVEIGEIRERTAGLKSEIETFHTTSSNSSLDIVDILKSIAKSDTEAKRVLGLSAQAGLARSYLTESSKLELRANVFTGLLYITAFATILIAALYVLPSLEHAIEIGANDQKTKVLVTLLRASILTPLIFVLYFTNRQISSIETLRMDYAEKAAASLAYSGYRDEMSADNSLLERLRSSLLLKFAEHPERLLRKIKPTESLSVSSPGFAAESSSGGKSDSAPSDG